MAFPTTTLLDDFNRANSATLGANWTEGDTEPDGPNGAGFEIISNQANNPSNLSASARWNAATFGPDTEVYGTLVSIPTGGTRFIINARITTPGSTTFDGYGLSLRIDGATVEYRLLKWTDGSRADVATQAVTFNAGDKMGLEVLSSGSNAVLRGYRYNGTSWSQEVSYTDIAPDAPYTSSGYIGFSDSVVLDGMLLDDFSGGTVSTGAAATFYNDVEIIATYV